MSSKYPTLAFKSWVQNIQASWTVKIGLSSSPDSDMWIQISKKGIFLFLRQVGPSSSPDSDMWTQISKKGIILLLDKWDPDKSVWEKKIRPRKWSHGIYCVTYPRHSYDRARHWKQHGPGTSRRRHESLRHRPYELIGADVSEFEAEPATKYLSRYFSL